MVVLRALAMLSFVVLGVANTVVAGTYGALVGFIPPRGDWTLLGARWWARGVLLGGFVRLRREGGQRVPRGGPVVFMANHESWLDIPALLSAVPVQVRFLAKKSLFKVPFLGWAISAMGFVPVDRENRREAVRSFEEAAARIRHGRSVLLFPEETRSSDGNLLPLQRGGFLIAIKAGIPIVPVGIEGAGLCLGKHNYLIRPGTVTVRFGDPIPTAGCGVTEKGVLMERVRLEIDRLRGNSGRAAAVAGDAGGAGDGH